MKYLRIKKNGQKCPLKDERQLNMVKRNILIFYFSTLNNLFKKLIYDIMMNNNSRLVDKI